MSFNKDKGGSSQQSNQTQTTTPQRTAEQRELDKLTLSQIKEFDPIQRELNRRGGNLINQLLVGDSNLPGFLSSLPGGISEEVTSDIARNSIRDIQPFFQQSGLLDSGVNASVSGRIAGDVRRASEEFNIGNLLNLLNLAVGGQAQVQSPALSQTQLLSQRLANVTPVTTTGSFGGNTSSFSNPSVVSRGMQFLGTQSGSNLTTSAILAACWVASEIFGGWMHPKTIGARIWVNILSPQWFMDAYYAHGERFAKFISNKPAFKAALRPFFEVISFFGWRYLNAR